MLNNSLMRFLLVGVSNTLLGMGIIYIAWRFLGLSDLSANLLGYGIGFMWSYTLNRLWTFGHTGKIGRSLLRFALVCAVAYLFNLIVLFTARYGMGPDTFMPHVLGMCAYTAIGYLGSRFFAFSHSASSFKHAGEPT